MADHLGQRWVDSREIEADPVTLHRFNNSILATSGNISENYQINQDEVNINIIQED